MNREVLTLSEKRLCFNEQKVLANKIINIIISNEFTDEINKSVNNFHEVFIQTLGGPLKVDFNFEKENSTISLLKKGDLLSTEFNIEHLSNLDSRLWGSV